MPARYQFTIATLACLFCAAFFACREQAPVRLGFLGGLTGRAAGLGASGRNGFLLAIEQANSSGGVHGRRVEAVVSDDHMDTSQAVTALQELYANQVVAVVGPMTSQVALAVVPEADRARVPMVSPTVSTNQLSRVDDYFLRVYYSNTQAAGMLADFLSSRRQKPRMAAIYDRSNRAYTEDWLKDFRGRYAQRGGELVTAIDFDPAAGMTFGTIVEQILQSRPGGILLLANAVDSAMLAQQLAKRGANVPLYATGWSYADDLLQLGGKAVEGLTILQSADQESRAPAYQSFAKLYQERFREPPNFPALHAYDATRAVLAALATGATDGPRLKDALLALPPTAGAQGTIAFDQFGDLRSPELHLATIRAGAFQSLH